MVRGQLSYQRICVMYAGATLRAAPGRRGKVAPTRADTSPHLESRRVSRTGHGHRGQSENRRTMRTEREHVGRRAPRERVAAQTSRSELLAETGDRSNSTYCTNRQVRDDRICSSSYVRRKSQHLAVVPAEIQLAAAEGPIPLSRPIAFHSTTKRSAGYLCWASTLIVSSGTGSMTIAGTLLGLAREKPGSSELHCIGVADAVAVAEIDVVPMRSHRV